MLADVALMVLVENFFLRFVFQLKKQVFFVWVFLLIETFLANIVVGLGLGLESFLASEDLGAAVVAVEVNEPFLISFAELVSNREPTGP